MALLRGGGWFRIYADRTGTGEYVECLTARHTHDTLFVQIASGSGFGRLVSTFRRALQMRRGAIVLRSCGFRKSQEKTGSTVRSGGKGWKPGGGKVFGFLLVSRERSQGKEDIHQVLVVCCLMDRHDAFVIDI